MANNTRCLIGSYLHTRTSVFHFMLWYGISVQGANSMSRNCSGGTRVTAYSIHDVGLLLVK